MSPILHIIDARVIGDHSLYLAFDDGASKVVDLFDQLYGPIFEPLRDPEYYSRMTLDRRCGTVVWPNGADYPRRRCTNCLTSLKRFGRKPPMTDQAQ